MNPRPSVIPITQAGRGYGAALTTKVQPRIADAALAAGVRVRDVFKEQPRIGV